MRLFKKIGIYAVCCYALCAPSFASAHATPVTYAPEASATVLSTPSSISIRFTERIEMGASSLTVYGPDGETVNQGKGSFAPNEERELFVPIADKGEGVYTVSWQVVSVDDGHFTKGAYSFLVDAEGTVFEGIKGTVAISYSSKLPEAAFDFLKLLGESIFLSACIFLLCIFKPLYRKRNPLIHNAAHEVSALFAHAIAAGYLAFAFGSICLIAHKSLELSALQNTPFLEALVVYLGSSVGTYLALKILAGTVFLGVWLFFRKKLFTAPANGVIAFLGIMICAILYMQSEISHAAASLVLPNVSVFITFIHLAAKEFVIGGVLMLLILLVALLRKKEMGLYAEIAPLFDLLACCALLLAGTSGAFISWLHLKHTINLMATQWGTLFIMLLLATLAFGFFRVLHQFVIHPRLSRSKVLQKMLLITLPCEVAVALLVLFYSGYISITTPPFIVAQYDFEETASSQGIAIDFSVHPHEHGAFLIELSDEATGQRIDPKHLMVTASNPEKNLGPNVLDTEERFIGGYVFQRADLSPEGEWEVEVIAKNKDGYDAHASFSFAYPQDVESSVRSDAVRHFDAFAQIMLGIGVCIALCCTFLFAHALKQIKKQKERNIAHMHQPSLAHFAFVPLLIVLVYGTIFGVFMLIGQSSFERLCEADGHQWRQSYPARDFETTSPNALNGCMIHGGHYHFVDMREYLYFKEHNGQLHVLPRAI